MAPKKPFHKAVAEKLIAQLKTGTAPWQKPWSPAEPSAYLPMNPTTGKRYKGINSIYLLAQGRSDARWMTYKQAAAAGAQVRKGEKGTPVQYYKFSEEQDKLDDQGQPVRDVNGKKIKETVQLERPRVFFATVFNGEQIDNLPPQQIKPKTEQQWNAVERAEHILNASGAKITHAAGDRAFYRPSTDSITMPERHQFDTADAYYATALHELGHWTGHPSRLDRDLGHPFGSEEYAKEELRAEISSLIVGEELNIGHDPGQHAAYVKSWIKVLEDDPLEIFRAASDAEKIQKYVLSLEQQQEQDITRQEAKQETQEAKMNKADKPDKPRNYINVPYKEKDEAKALGARWDKQHQSWYIPRKLDRAAFAKWSQNDTPQTALQTQERIYLAVPYNERQVAKAAGARWDKQAKSWYIGPQGDTDRLSRWLPENAPNQQDPTMSPREEFAAAMKSLDCVVSGDHPIMDGAKHRIAVDGDQKGERAGFYVGHLDGHPAGYIANNRTGINMKWKSKGYSLNPAEKAKLQAEAATKLAARSAALEEKQEMAAARISEQIKDLTPATEQTPYIKSKGIQAHPGVFTDAEGSKTYIPAQDADGKLWTMQYIQEDGTKRFAKDSRKEGCFHIVGGDLSSLSNAPALVLHEGYATAATNAEVLRFPTVAAFDAGNLPAVAEALHAKWPDKPVVILGDNDRYQEITQGTNPGKSKAQEAARRVGGKAILPVFAPGEADYPAGLAPVTPQSYRAHLHATKALETTTDPDRKTELEKALLSKEQQTALARIKRYTDFNDLATQSRLGREGLKRQVKITVNKAIEEVYQKRQQQTQQQRRTQRAAHI